MELVGPSFVIVKNGKLLNKYEIIARIKTPKGTHSTLYYFDTEKDAELYRLYLQQVEGEKELNNLIDSSRTHNWEKREYEAFKETIDWNELPNKVKNIKFTTVTEFVEIRSKKDE